MATVAPDVQVTLARYMERLDNYIESQATLNETIGRRLEKHGVELDELQNWRTKFMGAKWISGAVALLVLHTTVVLSAIMGMMRWIK